MKVKEVMTPDVKSICITQTLAEAAKEMWDNDCGALPVVKEHKVVGMLTDRDICMAGAMRDRSLAQISVEEIMHEHVHVAKLDENIEKALATMRDYKVRRLPVLNAEGELAGIVSMNDIVLKAKPTNGKKPPIEYVDVVKTYQAICAHLVPMMRPETTE